MDIVETPIFSQQVIELLTDDEYRLLQAKLLETPELGQLIPGSGGLRKVRWGAKGQGKRGGVRTIYYVAVTEDRLYMVYMYSKSERSDLTHAQYRILRKLIEED
jgi:hypothetical protein